VGGRLHSLKSVLGRPALCVLLATLQLKAGMTVLSFADVGVEAAEDALPVHAGR
jgi:hypothetical protein